MLQHLVSRYLDTESELVKIENIKQASEGSDATMAQWHNNLLLGTAFTKNNDATDVYSSAYDYNKVTDGIYKTDENGNINNKLSRYSSKTTSNVVKTNTVSN